MMDRFTGKSRGFAFITMNDGGQANAAMSALNGHALNDRTLVVGEARPREERPRPGTQPKLDGKAEARLIAEACSNAPEGRKHWTLHLLADRVVALGLAASYSYESVRRVLKKATSSRG